MLLRSFRVKGDRFGVRLDVGLVRPRTPKITSGKFSAECSFPLCKVEEPSNKKSKKMMTKVQ